MYKQQKCTFIKLQKVLPQGLSQLWPLAARKYSPAVTVKNINTILMIFRVFVDLLELKLHTTVVRKINFSELCTLYKAIFLQV